jgi:hypothetical protein
VGESRRVPEHTPSWTGPDRGVEAGLGRDPRNQEMRGVKHHRNTCQRSAETPVQHQPKHLSNISRISIKDQVTRNVQRQPKHDILSVPRVGFEHRNRLLARTLVRTPRDCVPPAGFEQKGRTLRVQISATYSLG